jgi:hypothetical protein
MCESLDGFDTAATRQNVGSSVRVLLAGGGRANDPLVMTSATSIVVCFNDSAVRLSHEAAQAGWE